MEVTVGQRAGAAGGDEGKLGVIGEESGWRVGGRGSVDDVAAKRASVLVGDRAGPAGCLGQDGEFVCNDGGSADIGEGGACTEDDGVWSDFDEAELLEVPEGDEFFGLETAGAQGDH